MIERNFAYGLWTKLLADETTLGRLVEFHAAHKLTLMARSPKHYTEMGQLVAKAGTIPWDELAATYGRLFMERLALLGTRRKHVNVLQHLMGCLRREVSSEDKQELLGLIEDYRNEVVPSNSQYGALSSNCGRDFPTVRCFLAAGGEHSTDC